MQITRWSVILALCIATVVDAHPDHEEDRLIAHFVIGGHGVASGKWQDETHTLTAKLVGDPKVAALGPAEGLTFNGTSDWLTLGPGAELQAKLPKKEFSLAAWVNVKSAGPWGGIAGWIEDNGNQEAGLLLGTKDNRFSLALATKGADDGDGKMTYLVDAKSEIEFGRWYYVVGTYDGQTMRLFVNGKPVGESKEQSGDILYPSRGEFVLGCYQDHDERYPLAGAMFETKLYRRALAAEEIQAVAKKNDNLIAWQPPVTTDLAFLVKPYLQFGTQTTMTVMCETIRPSVMTVEYATQQPLELKDSTKEPAAISELTLANLQPHTNYFYRVQCTDAHGFSVTSEILSFQTAPKADAAWSFAVIGDTQRNPEITRKCTEGAYALRPNFLLHCGDVVDNGHAKNQWVKDLFEPSSKLMSRVPTFPVIGNHEQNSHWYYDYFSLPKPEYYYTFEYGNAQYFMIDSNKPLKPDSEQYQWLEKALAASKATWKFTCHHHPCFTSDNNDYGDLDTGDPKKGKPSYGDKNAQQLVPLYEKYGVDIAFNGHIHVYERTWPILEMAINQKKGVRYITSGGGGGHLEEAASQRAWFSLHFKKAYHFCYATIHDRTIQFKAYDVEERLFDTFELTKPAER